MRTRTLIIAAIHMALLQPCFGAGPLRKHSVNGRYFTDDSGSPIYLTGSHAWGNQSDGFFCAPNQDPPTPFDYVGYLNLLQKQNHNFIRLWSGIVLPKAVYNDRRILSGTFYVTPLPYARTGPGIAQDGKPKFDLMKFNQDYFDRLRTRVIAARDRGIYVGIMLFEGWQAYGLPGDKGWDFSSFHPSNNVNGINGDPNGDGYGKEVSTLDIPAVTNIQKALIRKFVDTLNDLDNVLYEIANEAGSASIDWQYEMIDYLREYERTQPTQHPVGMTSPAWGGAKTGISESSADWISPGTAVYDSPADPYVADPPVADGAKVSILDSDHIFYFAVQDSPNLARSWVWKSFMRGHNPILMEDLSDHSGWIAARAAMGQTLTYARRLNLTHMIPQNALSSTSFCLADPGVEYLVYQPAGKDFTVELQAGTYDYEWFNPASGLEAGRGVTKAKGGPQQFTPPFADDAVLFLKAR